MLSKVLNYSSRPPSAAAAAQQAAAAQAQRKVCRSEKTLTGTTSTTLACTLSSKLSAFPFEVKFSDLT